MYTEDELIPLSGLQHIAFCQRQWALIHIEQIWVENRLTAEGRLLHERAHEQTEELRGGLLISRGLPLRSLELGVSGQADAVEFARVTEGGFLLPGRSGRWIAYPVEYKRGKPKRELCDRVQLCAQAICLEETFGIPVPTGALYYGTPRRRTDVQFDDELRSETARLAEMMHRLFRAGKTPPAVYIKACESCSLKEACGPAIPASAASHMKQLLTLE